MKKTWILPIGMVIVLLVVSCVSVPTNAVTNSHGYKIKNDIDNAYFEITPVLCNGETAVVLLDQITDKFDFGRDKLRPVDIMVFSEKVENDWRYFWCTNYQSQKSSNGYDFFGNPKYKTSFFIADNAKKIYIDNIDEIYPQTIADRYANTILFMFGGTTGGGNISSKNQIKREELAYGEKLRQRPLFYWKENYPYIYEIIISRIPHWKEFSTPIQEWMAKIVQEGKITGHDDLLAAAAESSAQPKRKIDPVTEYRGSEAVDYIAIGANNLYSQGRISAAALQRILNYIQLNHGQDVYLFMDKHNYTAEEFCLGVSRGEIYLQF